MPKRGHIRIIGGRWRRRQLRVAAVEGLRPSTDSLREMLFSWLPPRLDGYACLDLFAGSGAFGFEAASRGAARVVMVESHPTAVNMLRANHRALCGGDGAAADIDIVALTVDRYLRRPPGGFDLVFIDPPFAAAPRLIQPTCESLCAGGVLAAGAQVYIESRGVAPLPIPGAWHIIRSRTRGVAQATLIQT